MTHEDRETLLAQLRDLQREIASTANGAHCYGVWSRTIGEISKFIRATLIERTCGTCKWLRDHQPTHGAKVAHRCGNWDSLADEAFDLDLDDGCVKGWEPKEGA